MMKCSALCWANQLKGNSWFWCFVTEPKLLYFLLKGCRSQVFLFLIQHASSHKVPTKLAGIRGMQHLRLANEQIEGTRAIAGNPQGNKSTTIWGRSPADEKRRGEETTTGWYRKRRPKEKSCGLRRNSAMTCCETTSRLPNVSSLSILTVRQSSLTCCWHMTHRL